jgi:hypothetical protein
MPGPDPEGVWIDDCAGMVTALWPTTNRKHRFARLRAIERRMRLGLWRCAWCGGPLPLERRADAQYCGESCRKRAARGRRKRWLERFGPLPGLCCANALEAGVPLSLDRPILRAA